MERHSEQPEPAKVEVARLRGLERTLMSRRIEILLTDGLPEVYAAAAIGRTFTWADRARRGAMVVDGSYGSSGYNEDAMRFDQKIRNSFQEHFASPEQIAARETYCDELAAQQIPLEKVVDEFEKECEHITAWSRLPNLGTMTDPHDREIHDVFVALAHETLRKPSLRHLMHNPQSYAKITEMLAAYLDDASNAADAGVTA